MFAVLTAVAPLAACGEDKPAAPQIHFVAPLAAVRGEANELTLRGMNLDQATAVRLADPLSGIEVQIKQKEKAAPPGGLTPETVGDTQLIAAFQLPPDAPESVTLIVAAPGGEASSQPVAVASRDGLAEEKESNAGFREAQPVTAGQVMRGVIREPRDVDTFQFRGEAGQTATIVVQAAAMGSPIDPLLMVFDERGQMLASRDDGEESADPELSLVLPDAGVVFIAVLDALDKGSPLHHYLLSVKTP